MGVPDVDGNGGGGMLGGASGTWPLYNGVQRYDAYVPGYRRSMTPGAGAHGLEDSLDIPVHASRVFDTLYV